MFRGFLSTDWRRIQNSFFAQRTGISGKLDTGQHWAQGLVSWYFAAFRIAWFQRNLDKHGDEEFGQQVIHKARLSCTIRRLYVIGESFPDHERHPICKDSIDTILDAKLRLQELWIADPKFISYAQASAFKPRRHRINDPSPNSSSHQTANLLDLGQPGLGPNLPASSPVLSTHSSSLHLTYNPIPG